MKTPKDGSIPRKPTIAFLKGEIKALERFNEQQQQELNSARDELRNVYTKLGRWFVNKNP